MSEKSPEKTFDDIFRPPPGGDVTLRSSDGVEFLAHSVILGIASSVFASLLVVGTNKDAVELSETADTVSPMLQFMYPNIASPTMTSIKMLSRCLRAAQKYDLGGMIETLDKEISTDTTAQSLIQIDPLRIHQLALQFNLPKAQVAAAPLVLTDKADVCDPSKLSGLVKNYPSASLIRLAAIQGTRAKILADVLFHFYQYPIKPSVKPSMFYDLSCHSCQKWLGECKESSARTWFYYGSPPSWVLAWATLVYQTLLASPLEKSDHLFDAFILNKLEGADNVCQDCLRDFWTLHSQRTDFNKWAEVIKGVLKQRLESVHHLHAL